MPKISPWRTVRLIPSTARVEPYVLERFSATTASESVDPFLVAKSLSSFPLQSRYMSALLHLQHTTILTLLSSTVRTPYGKVTKVTPACRDRPVAG